MITFHAEPSPDGCWRILHNGKAILFLTPQAFYTSDPAECLEIVAALVAGLSAYETSKGTP